QTRRRSPLLLADLSVLEQDAAQFREPDESIGELDVTACFVLRHREQTRRTPGGPGYERELALFCARLRPLEVVPDLRWLVVLIDANEREIEVVARKHEVVGVAAERGDAGLGREDEAH